MGAMQNRHAEFTEANPKNRRAPESGEEWIERRKKSAFCPVVIAAPYALAC
jgi:hypothetical protein